VDFKTLREDNVVSFSVMASTDGGATFEEVGQRIVPQGEGTVYSQCVPLCAFVLHRTLEIRVDAIVDRGPNQRHGVESSPTLALACEGLIWAGYYNEGADDVRVRWFNTDESDVVTYSVLLLDGLYTVISQVRGVLPHSEPMQRYEVVFPNIPFHQSPLHTAIRVFQENGNYITTRPKEVGVVSYLPSMEDRVDMSVRSRSNMDAGRTMVSIPGSALDVCWYAFLDASTHEVLVRWSNGDEGPVSSYSVFLLDGPRTLLALQRGIRAGSSGTVEHEVTFDKIPLHKNPLMVRIEAAMGDGAVARTSTRIVTVVMGSQFGMDCIPDTWSICN